MKALGVVKGRHDRTLGAGRRRRSMNRRGGACRASGTIRPGRYYLRALIAAKATSNHLQRATRRERGRCFGSAKRGTASADRVWE